MAGYGSIDGTKRPTNERWRKRMETKSIGVVARDSVAFRRESTVKSQKLGLSKLNADFSQFFMSGPQKAPPALGQLNLADILGTRQH